MTVSEFASTTTTNTTLVHAFPTRHIRMCDMLPSSSDSSVRGGGQRFQYKAQGRFKVKANQMLIETIQAHLSHVVERRPLHVLTLDSTCHLTSQALLSEDMATQDTIFLLESDPRTYQHHVRHGYMTFFGECESLLTSSTFRECYLPAFDVVYIDFQRGVRLGGAFMLSILEESWWNQEECILGFTFSKRITNGDFGRPKAPHRPGRPAQRKHAFEQQYARFWKDLVRIAKQRGFRTIMQHSLQYGDSSVKQSNMFTAYVYLSKHVTP